MNTYPTDVFAKYYVKFSKYTTVTIAEYQEAFKSIRKITQVTKCRDFQYRLLANAIFTNNRLYHWKITESNVCEYCNQCKQTPKHLLCTCIKGTRNLAKTVPIHDYVYDG